MCNFVQPFDKKILQVWLVDHGGATLLCSEEQEQLYTGDCYIVKYSYVDDRKDYHLFFAWSGKNSVKVRL